MERKSEMQYLKRLKRWFDEYNGWEWVGGIISGMVIGVIIGGWIRK